MPLITTVSPHLRKPNVLEVTGLTGGPEGLKLFSNIGISLSSGVSALIGDEGVGKTSLLRLLAGDLCASHGAMSILGFELPLSRPNPMSIFWCDLRLPLHNEDRPEACWNHFRQHLPNWSESTQNRLVTDFQLTPHLGKRLNMLSTGSRRKVGLIAALASGASVTLIDQAFVSLDKSAIQVVERELRHANTHLDRTWLVADYEIPLNVPLSSVLTLT